MYKVLVTGATGFLGSSIVRQLQAAGHAVRSTGRSPGSGLPDYRPLNLTSQTDLSNLVAGTRCVVHSAGLAHQFGRVESEALFFQTNVAASESLARAAAPAGVEHFVFISSASVYDDRHLESHTEDSPCRPCEAYAESKFEAESRLARVANESGMRLTILRPATLYGAGDPGNVARLMRAIDRRHFVWIGTGENLKSLIHRDDVARAVVLAVSRASNELVSVYNVSAPPVFMRDVVDILADALGAPAPRVRVSPHLVRLPLKLAGTIGFGLARVARWQSTLDKWLRDDVIDGSKFYREFGFAPDIKLVAGLYEEVAWYREVALDRSLSRAA